MTGLIGWSSGYRAMEHCDALIMLGTDFPYRPFYPPEGTPIIQVDVRGEQIGRRAPVEVPLVGTVKDTARTARQELSLPPKVTFEQAKGFTPYATRTILSGGAADTLESARTNLRELRGE